MNNLGYKSDRAGWKRLALLLATSSAVLVSCNASTYEMAIGQARELGGLASRIYKDAQHVSVQQIQPVFLQNAQRISDLQANVAAQELFGKAQAVGPLQFWRSKQSLLQAGAFHDPSLANLNSQNDAYTLLFYDFFGVPYAYVNQITRGSDDLTPRALLTRHKAITHREPDNTKWVDATIVTGANTRRAAINAYTEGFPVLNGLYSTESAAKGFDVNRVVSLVMPEGSTFWAQVDDGRYFDLLGQEWVSQAQVAFARDQYANAVIAAKNAPGFEREMTRIWKNMQTAYGVEVAPCPVGAELCLETKQEDQTRDRISTAWVAPNTDACRVILWWTECDPSATHGRLDWPNEFPDGVDNVQARYPDYTGPATGCTPTAGTNLLWWWQEKAKKGILLRPGGMADDGTWRSSKVITQIELLKDMESWVEGRQRATKPWMFNTGMNRYFARHGIAFTANDAYGLGATDASEFHYRIVNNLERERPVAFSHGWLGGSCAHTGLLRTFWKASFSGTLIATWYESPCPGFTDANLSEPFSYSGVHWIYPNDAP